MCHKVPLTPPCSEPHVCVYVCMYARVYMCVYSRVSNQQIINKRSTNVSRELIAHGCVCVCVCVCAFVFVCVRECPTPLAWTLSFTSRPISSKHKWREKSVYVYVCMYVVCVYVCMCVLTCLQPTNTVELMSTTAHE